MKLEVKYYDIFIIYFDHFVAQDTEDHDDTLMAYCDVIESIFYAGHIFPVSRFLIQWGSEYQASLYSNG